MPNLTRQARSRVGYGVAMSSGSPPGAPSAEVAPRVLLPAPSGQAWLRTHLAEHLGAHADGEPSAEREWLAPADLQARKLAELHAFHVAAGATSQAAAKWLGGWFAGGLGDPVGFTLAYASAALLFDLDAVRWRMHRDQWPERVEIDSPRLAVAADHPWAGEDGVTVLPSQDAVRKAALATVLTVGSPIVGACLTLARVGVRAMWAEIGDGFGLALVHRPELPVVESAADELRRALELPAAPWRARPTLTVADTLVGPAYLGRRGGCCLAYQCTEPEPESAADERDAYHSAYRERFPHPEGTPAYCTTCSLRPAEEVAARQRFWVEFQRGQSAATRAR